MQVDRGGLGCNVDGGTRLIDSALVLSVCSSCLTLSSNIFTCPDALDSNTIRRVRVLLHGIQHWASRTKEVWPETRFNFPTPASATSPNLQPIQHRPETISARDVLSHPRLAGLESRARTRLLATSTHHPPWPPPRTPTAAGCGRPQQPSAIPPLPPS